MDDFRLRMMELGQRGYYCSQIILSLGLEAQGKHDPDLIRAMAGLARGAGNEEGTCGALTGAACLFGLHAGKGQESETEGEDLWPMLAELWEWFAGEFNPVSRAVECGHLLKEGAPADQGCGQLIAMTYAKAVEILMDHGFDPSEPPDG